MSSESVRKSSELPATDSGKVECKKSYYYHHHKTRSNSPLSRIVQCIENMTTISDYDLDMISESSAPSTSKAVPVTVDTHSPLHQSHIPSSFCADPTHLHSFTQLSMVSSLIKSKFYTCQVCDKRDSTYTLMSCIACGLFIHRSCLGQIKNEQNCNNKLSVDQVKLLQICPVNQQLLQERESFLIKHGYEVDNDCKGKRNDLHSEEDVNDSGDHAKLKEAKNTSIEHTHETLENNIHKCDADHTDTNDENHSQGDDESSENEYIWSQNGPPLQHWALSTPDALRGMKSSKNIQDEEIQRQPNGQQEEDQEQRSDLKATLSNLSKALQENWLMHLTHRSIDDVGVESESDSIVKKSDEKSNDLDSRVIVSSTDVDDHFNACTETNNVDDPQKIMNDSKVVMKRIAQHMSSPERSCSISETSENVACDDSKLNDTIMLEEVKPKEIPSLTTKVQDTVATINTSVDMVKTAQTTRKSIGIASVAGTIAGGAVGLVVAGPAGAYLGSRIGQIGAVAGILIEGSLRIGVLVAGVKGTMFTVNQLQDSIGKTRVLTIGENDSECKVVLVRPNIIVDPVWESITLDARKSAPKDENKGFIPGLNFLSSNDSIAKQGRKKRDSDIVNSEESEISVKEKIFLLVSSSLNDKNSLPGYVYRKLVEKLRCRAINALPPETNSNEEMNDNRRVRQDVHAIIKHITATLLEVRPGFASSPRITELSASAVESLVFGEVYDLVFDEIIEETKQKDKELSDKIVSAKINPSLADFISCNAMNALKLLPEQHSVAEKLTCCVRLLESISEQGEMQDMSADSLLRIVCQHIVIANVQNLNAECLFLEEFASDEQLLHGREGYALVTLQASLHFLNVCSDLISDVFTTHQQT